MTDAPRTAPLTCPVKGCGEPLSWEERRCACPRGHSFDRARSGYVNLLTPQDKRSKAPGDSKEAVRARGRLLERGLGAHVLEALTGLLPRAGLPGGARALDVGCGDGFFLARLAQRFPLDAYGVDISAAALEAAARRSRDIRWIAANADRRLPFGDRSFDLILSITSRRNAAELERLLRPGGSLIVAVPARDDLAELRAAVLGADVRRDRGAAVERTLAVCGLELRERFEARASLLLEGEALRDLLAATYRGARRSEATRAAALDRMEVTASAEVLRFCKAWNEPESAPL
jgi:23S rRNA (guanine745-N1)-methyltransferase